MRKFIFTFGSAIAFGGFVFAASQATAPTVPQSSAVLRGKIILEGQPPVPRAINMRADPACQNFSATVDDIRVSDSGLENVIVSVSSGVEGSFPPPPAIVILDQRDCVFYPRVLTVQVGQRFLIQNNNRTAQNVHAWSQVNRPFNVSLALAGVQVEKSFDKPEAPFPIRCDVHSWEVSFVAVFDHPFHTISRAGGAYELRLPPGEYEITAWHERLGTLQQTVRVGAADNPPLNFTFKQP